VKPIKSIDDPRYVKALSHPIRVRVLALLEERMASPVELAEVLGVSLGSVSYHVRNLHRLGLIELKKETRRRGAIEHHYKAKERPSVSDKAWSEATPIAKQAMVGSMLRQMQDYADASAAAGGFDRSDAHITRTRMKLDEQGWHDLSKACHALLEEAANIERDAEGRLEEAGPDAPSVDVGLIMLMFEGTPMMPASDGRRSGGALRGRDRPRRTVPTR
jgi:DNA-binding transcriptional ArsR family regulator